LHPDCVLLLSLVAHVAAPTANASAGKLFAEGAARLAKAGPSSTALVPVAAMNYANIRTTLDRARQLAPLEKPALIKALLCAAGEVEPMPLATADLLRAICAALEAPIPPSVAATYTSYHW